MKEKTIEFKRICEELSTLYVDKNEEYGDSFGAMFKEDGLAPCLYQIKHKLNRALTLADEEKTPKFESLEDTLRDMANYSIMTLLEYTMLEKEKTKKQKSSTTSQNQNFETKEKKCTCDTKDKKSTYTTTGSKLKKEDREFLKLLMQLF